MSEDKVFRPSFCFHLFMFLPPPLQTAQSFFTLLFVNGASPFSPFNLDADGKQVEKDS